MPFDLSLIIRKAEKFGAKEAEAFLIRRRKMSSEIKGGEIDLSSTKLEEGVGLRVVLDKGRVGFSYSNDPSKQEELIKKSIKVARANEEDENWPSIPCCKNYRRVKNFYKEVVNMGSDEVVEMSKLMLDSAKLDERVQPFFGSSEVTYDFRELCNTQGIHVEEESTLLSLNLSTIARENGKVSPICFEYDVSRSKDVDPERVGREASEIALKCLEHSKIESGEKDVLFSQEALMMLWLFTISQGIKGDQVQRETSFLAGKIGEKVASEKVSLSDDGTLEGGVFSHSFDDEGVPCQKTEIISDGTLKGFIYDHYSARKEGKESTGNAWRGRDFFGEKLPYTSVPRVATTNLVLEKGRKSLDQLIDEIDEGVLVRSLQGAHSSDPESGSFSVVATPSFLIEKGEVKGLLRGIMLSGNAFSLLEKVRELSRETRTAYFLVAPWILFEDVRVIAKGSS